MNDAIGPTNWRNQRNIASTMIVLLIPMWLSLR